MKPRNTERILLRSVNRHVTILRVKRWLRRLDFVTAMRGGVTWT